MKNQDKILEQARAIETASPRTEGRELTEQERIDGMMEPVNEPTMKPELENLRNDQPSAASSLKRVIVDNPGPALLIGAGLGWLFINREREKEKALHQRMMERGHSLRESTQESVSGLKDTTSSGLQSIQETMDEKTTLLAEKGRSAGHYVAQNYRDVRENNPMILGACALLGGLAIGLMLPPTTREDSLMGDARNTVFEQAKKIVEDARDAAVSTLRSGKERVADSLQETGQEMKDTAKLAYENAKEETIDNLKASEEA